MYRWCFVGLAMTLLVLPSAVVSIAPPGPIFASGESCVFEAPVTFDPPLGPDTREGTMAIGVGAGDCAAFAYICMDPSTPTDCLECPIDGIPTEGTPICAGTYSRPIGDGALSFRGDCRFATLAPSGEPTASGGALVAGAVFVMKVAFVGPNGVPGLKSITGTLSPVDGDPCGLSAALCTCHVLNLLYVPP